MANVTKADEWLQPEKLLLLEDWARQGLFDAQIAKNMGIGEATLYRYKANHPEIKEDNILVIPHENWHHGIVGIVSSKITEKFYKPSILFAIDGDEAKGSGRSVSGFNLFEIKALF